MQITKTYYAPGGKAIIVSKLNNGQDNYKFSKKIFLRLHFYFSAMSIYDVVADA